MSEAITIYVVETGEITGIRRAEIGEPIVLPPTHSWVLGTVDGSLNLIDPATGEAILKPEMPIEIDGNVLSGIPDGTTLIYNLTKHPEPITGGEFEFDVDAPQTVHVSMRHSLFLTWEGDIVCTP